MQYQKPLGSIPEKFHSWNLPDKMPAKQGLRRNYPRNRNLVRGIQANLPFLPSHDTRIPPNGSLAGRERSSQGGFTTLERHLYTG